MNYVSFFYAVMVAGEFDEKLLYILNYAISSVITNYEITNDITK